MSNIAITVLRGHLFARSYQVNEMEITFLHILLYIYL